MDFLTRKLNVVEYIIGLKDDKILRLLELTIQNSQKEYEESTPLFSKQELADRAKQATTDYLTGHCKSQEQLEQESEDWY